MKKISLSLAALFMFGATLKAQNGNHQPYTNYWHPATLLTWTAAGDASAKFNKGKVPLATRFSDVAATTCGSSKPAGLKLASLAITNANTSGNPAQGYDHAGEYAFTFWQYLDYFVMWGGSAGEGLILTPNATWIDAGHKNGVKVMGTVFMPPVAYGGQLQWLNDLLQTDANGNFPVADKLIEVADYYGFDGWFINQETGGGNAALGEKMIAFMKYFQQHKTSNMEIMWYDAMLPSGPVTWQRELNTNNQRMFQDGSTLVSQTMFLDFAWNATRLANSKTRALALGRSNFDLLAGIDVQANGYNTNVGWSSIFPTVANPNTSVGLYVPSWTFHSSPDKNDLALFYQREMRFWMGANNNPCNAPASGWPGFAKYYIEKSAITSLPFVTRFNTGHSNGGFWVNGNQVSTKQWHNQSAQDFLPTYRWLWENVASSLTVDWDFTTAYNGGNSLKLSGTVNNQSKTIKLFNTRLLLGSGNEQLRIRYKMPGAGASNMKLALTFTDAPGTYVYFDVDPATSASWQTQTITLGAHQNKTINTIGLSFQSATAVNDYSINIGEIAVLPAPGTVQSAGNVQLNSYISCGNAELDVTFTESTGSNIWYYDIYRVKPDNTKEWLGRTPNNAFYVKNIKQIGTESSTTIEVVAVSNDGTEAVAATRAFTWPAPSAQTTNYALSLNGSSKYVNAGTIDLTGTALSLEGWIKPRSFKSSSPYITSFMGIEEGSGTAMLRLGDVSVPNNKLQFVLTINGTTRQLTANTALNTNTWYHIAATYDGTTMRLYINGVEDATLQAAGSVTANGTFYVGRNSDNGRILDGWLDEIRVWKKALTAAEINTNKCTVAPASANLEAYWTFDNCKSVVIDQTAHAHDGAPVALADTDWVTDTPCDMPNAIQEVNGSKAAVEVFPNPARANTGISIQRSVADEATFTLYDAKGVQVSATQHIGKNATVQLPNLAAGTYFYKIVSPQHTTVNGKLTIK